MDVCETIENIFLETLQQPNQIDIFWFVIKKYYKCSKFKTIVLNLKKKCHTIHDNTIVPKGI